MTRRLLAVALLGGMPLVVPGRLQAQANAMNPQNTAGSAGKEVLTSKGRTWIDYPMPLFTFIVDPNGKWLTGPGVIRVSHTDPALTCAKVQRVYATSGGEVASVRLAGGQGLCNFNMGDGKLSIPWSSENDASYGALCTAERRMSGWQGIQPYHKDLSVAMQYNSGKAEDLAGAQRPIVAVGCQRTTCAALTVRPGIGGPALPDAGAGRMYAVGIFAGGRNPVTYEARGLPPGMQMRADGFLAGFPTTPGSFPVTLTATDGCPAVQSAKVVATLKVKDTQAPAIAGFTVAPDTLPSGGGTVTLTVLASDNLAISRIMMTTRHPDGHSGSAQVPMTGGTSANGTWKISFSLGGNSTSTPVSYAFTVNVSDLDGNTVQGGPKTVVIAAHADPKLPAQPLKRP